jgi:hypothetical protein
MTATSHHGFHPDAESLSAFSEQALEGRERGEVLAHLAVCGRCREVVALASEAAAAGDVKAAAPSRKAVAPNSWWKQWRLVWVPTAVVAAFAAASISVYIERVDRHAANTKVAEQNPNPSATPPPAPAPTEQAKVEPPAAEPPAVDAPATQPAHPAKRVHSRAEERVPAAAPPAVAAKMPSESETPEPETMNQAEAYREMRQPPHAEATPAPPELTAGAMHPADSQPKSNDGDEEKKQAGPRRQAEVDRSQMRNLNARAAPFATRGANGAQPAGATETVTVTAAPPLEAQPAASAEPAPMFGIKSSGDVTTPAKPIRLPSGLMAVSVASGRHFLLAIDEAGALFLSEDRGVTWEHVTKQWMGRAVAVRREARDHGAPQADTTAQNGTTSDGTTSDGAGGGSSAPSLVEFFELTNDKNDTWVSTDGRTWTPK